MSNVVLHPMKNQKWNTMGLGLLVDIINPIVKQERNGVYELTFQYPVTGSMYSDLKVGNWVVCNAGATVKQEDQRFQIANVTKPMNGIVTVYCEHYRYQFVRSVLPVRPKVTVNSATTLLNNQIRPYIQPQLDFTFTSDIVGDRTFDASDPSTFANVQEVLGGVSGSVLDLYGGDYVFDNNEVSLLADAGTKSKVVIAYGKNLQDITQEDSIENTYTSVYGWSRLEGQDGADPTFLTLPEYYIDSDYVGNYTARRIKMVDFSSQKPTTVDQLRNLVKNYIKNNDIGIPKVSIKATLADLASSVLPEELKRIEALNLCDTVTIEFSQYGISTQARIVAYEWNVLLDRYESLTIGEPRTNFTKVVQDTIDQSNQNAGQIDFLQDAVNNATDILTNPQEGHVVIYPSLADPQEILIMDTTDVNTARKLWRWNSGGLGYSSTGYNGSYGLAMTNDGTIVADRMTTGTLRAIDIIGVNISGSTITGSTIISELGSYKTTMTGGNIETSYAGKRFINMGGSAFELYKTNGTGVLGGLYRTVYQATGREYLNLSAYPGTDLHLGRWTGSAHLGTLHVDGDNGVVGIDTLKFGGDVNGNDKAIKNVWASGYFKIPNNTTISFFSNLNMNGFSIVNQSDIRLKENIEDTKINGIEEIKKLNFVEFDRKQDYQTKDERAQPNSEREFGLIAQYSPFLAQKNDHDNYLGINVNKQVMLNSLTLKQLIAMIEKKDEQLEDQKKRIQEQEKCIQDQEKSIQDQETRIQDQEKSIQDQEKSIQDQETRIQDLEARLSAIEQKLGDVE